MKNRKIILTTLLFTLLVFALAIAACDTTPSVQKFTGITFDDTSVTYDGQEHELLISGTLPEGTQVTYESNKGTEIGEYNAKVTLTKENYEPLTLTAKLTITKGIITGIFLTDVTTAYDGQEHELLITGTLPEGAEITYENNKGTEIGEYNAKATITKENYETLVLNAKLTITKASFIGITFGNHTTTYDGQEHELLISGTLPEGAQIAYENNKGTNAGEYNAKVTITKENYNTLVLNAKLTINKADFSDLTLKNKTTAYTGSEHSIQVEGTLPLGTNVTYQNNNKTEEGRYNVVATITNPNYNTLTLNATLNIINVLNVATTFVSNVIDAPDPWSFIPVGLRMDNMAYAQMPVNDFTSFVNVSSIGKKSIGKQLNVLYDGLIDTSTALAYVDKVYAVAGTIAEMYQKFINDNPDNFAEFSGEAGGFKFYINLDGDNSLLLAGNSTVSIELQYNGETQERRGRIQITDGIALKYIASSEMLKLAVKTTVKGVGNLKQIEFAQNDTATAGYFYEYTGTETKNLKTSAVIAFNETKTVVVSNKRETEDLIIKGYEEVYNSKTGEYIGGEVGETVKNIEYDTLWFMLDDVTGINTVKAIDKANGTNSDTLYLNNSTEAMHTKLVGLEGGISKSTSRRFDVEMKDVWYIVATEADGKVKYEKQKASIPMLFVQKENVDTFGEDMYEKNKNTGITSQPTLPATKMANITNDYEMMTETFATIKEQVTFADIIDFIGSKNPIFDKTAN